MVVRKSLSPAQFNLFHVLRSRSISVNETLVFHYLFFLCSEETDKRNDALNLLVKPWFSWMNKNITTWNVTTNNWESNWSGFWNGFENWFSQTSDWWVSHSKGRRATNSPHDIFGALVQVIQHFPSKCQAEEAQAFRIREFKLPGIDFRLN